MNPQNEESLALLPELRRQTSTAIARPKRRWVVRVLLPLVIVFSAAVLLAYSARSVILPATEVWVAPVIPVARSADEPLNEAEEQRHPDNVLMQAPGWIEPSPFPINVPVFAEGVVRELFVLEGDTVASGQIVATLFDEDARLRVAEAEAQLSALEAEVAKLHADFAVAKVRVEELEDQLNRAHEIESSGGGARGESVQLEFRLRAARHGVEAAGAALDVARAHVNLKETARSVAQLKLTRTQLIAPAAGVVMSTLFEPGLPITRSGRHSDEAGESAIGPAMRLYDPKKLQVRVDVPLADIAQLRIGSLADVETEALPDAVFRGVVTRIVHQANIQRNTVQFKVSIENPHEVLKPEMLVRVRFYGGHSSTGDETKTAVARSETGMRLLIPHAALIENGERHRVWLVLHEDRAGTTVAVSREVEICDGKIRGHAEVTEGLQAGDRVIVEPPNRLQVGDRVRVMGEREETPPTSSEEGRR